MLNMIKASNFILMCDSYKVNHYLELPEGTKRTYSAIVPRKPSKYATKIVAMGQTYAAILLANVRVTHAMIDEAEIEIHEQGYLFNRADWEVIADEFDGRLPLDMFAVEEGRVVDPQTPVVGIINTDDRFAWLPAYIETIVQCIIWKMSTVASICRAARITIAEYMVKTGADMSMLDYKLHNFGDRGADSPESAIMAAIAHAVMFSGSDCTQANGYIKAMYKTKKAYTSSVEATEHSVMCANSDAGKLDDFGAAKMAVARLHKVVERTKAGIGIPVMSVVIDTYDDDRFSKQYMGGLFREEIIHSGGKMVQRPDSGDPRVQPAKIAHNIEVTFGCTVNQQGYKVLHPATGVLQGDGVRIETLPGIVKAWCDAMYSMDGLVLGMGSGVTHDGARDDFSFSMKAIASYDGVKWRRLLKQPITDLTKKSLSGLVRCKEVDDKLVVYDAMVDGSFEDFTLESDGWRCWVHNGARTFFQSFDDVRERGREGIL